MLMDVKLKNILHGMHCIAHVRVDPEIISINMKNYLQVGLLIKTEFMLQKGNFKAIISMEQELQLMISQITSF
jgi:predicted transcriptional regulator